MEIRELEYFVTVVECGNMSDAARKLFITQPTLSWNIKKLESNFRVQLLIRSNKGIQLTDVGRFVYLECRTLLSEAQSLNQRIRDYTSQHPHIIRVGLTPFTAVDYMYMFYEFEKKYPEFKIEIVNMGSKKLQKMVLDGQLDLALVSEPMIDSSFYKRKLDIKHGFHEIGLVVNKYHPLSTFDAVSFADLVNEKVVTLSDEYVLFDAVTTKFENTDSSTGIAFASENWELLLQHVQHWNSVAILPDDCKHKIDTSKLAWVPFKSNEFRRFNLFFISKSNKPLFPFFDPVSALYESIHVE